MRYPDKPCLVYYDNPITFAQFQHESELIAGFLQQDCGVKKGDRVLICMQNSPQFMLAYYGILRADAVVVPVSPMALAHELAHYAADSGASVAFVAQDLLAKTRDLLGKALARVIVATYGDYVQRRGRTPVPAFVAEPRSAVDDARATPWADMLALRRVPGAMRAGPGDLCLMPYTSGTTGQPRACMHTHRSVMFNSVSYSAWTGSSAGSVSMAVLPMFHATGMQGGMNIPMYQGSTVIVLSRWDRDAAAIGVQTYGVTNLGLITTMVVDFVSNPRLGEYDFSSLRRIGGGGAAMPRGLADMLKTRFGIVYSEGYGMTETIAATHMNPPGRPKLQCLGLPIFDVDARIVDPDTLAELPSGATGEIVIHGPQVMQGYWNDARGTAESFIEIDGRRFLRTGDLGRVDEEGYFFFVDRLKRMINAAGFKVWPAEVEAALYRHPAVHEACVIAARHARRGETVKACIVKKPGFDDVSDEDIMAWARENMAAYKIPRIVAFVDHLPKSGSGKVLWRELQARESGAQAAIS